MVTFKPSFVVFVLWCLMATAHACVWPDFFMLPAPADTGNETDTGDQLAETSWQTDGKIRDKEDQRVNGYATSWTWVTPVTNDTMTITQQTKGAPSSRNVTTLECRRGFGNGKFLVQVKQKLFSAQNKDISPADTYQCIQLVRRSPFVLQWARGYESRQLTECQDGFADISPWPLVYYPVRDPNTQEAESFHELHQQYQACPKLGGFHIRAYHKKGVAVEDGCQNNFPSPRLEMECYHGDGVRILQNNQNCTSYVNKRDSGAKFSCLGTWEVGDDTFSVLVPNDVVAVHSFHCLRINHKKPNSTNAILFLDTQCQPGSLSGVEGEYFILDLRRVPSPRVCDDFSDQCSRSRCDSMPYSCIKTCKKCSLTAAERKSEFDESIRGKWMLPTSGLQKILQVGRHQMNVFGFGYFATRGPIDEHSCLQAPEGWDDDDDVFGYVLSGPGNGPGCGPRVSQVRAKKVSDSVLLFQMPAPAPLRDNSALAVTGQWCHNNYRDIYAFEPLFRPYAPYAAIPRQKQENDEEEEETPNLNGYFTLIKQKEQEPASTCINFDDKSDLSYAADQTVTLEFKDETGEDMSCDGKSKMEGNEWKLDYTCRDGAEISTTFSCLGDYKVSDDYHAVVIKAPKEVAENASLSLRDEYYCLLIPEEDEKDKPMLLNQAANCDASFLHFAERKFRMPVARFINGSPAQQASVVTVVLLFFALIVSNLY